MTDSSSSNKTERFVWSWGRLWARGEQPSVEYNPILIESVPSVRSMCTGNGRIVALSMSGDVYTWGNTDKHILSKGNNNNNSNNNANEKDKTYIRKFTPLPTNKDDNINISFITCGRNRIFGIHSDTGQVYSWNSNNQSNKNDDYYRIPSIYETLSTLQITEISCGSTFFLALTIDGKVYSWGKQPHERLDLNSNHVDNNNNDSNDISSPYLVDVLCHLNTLHISCGWSHAAAITTDGSVYTWGYGGSGRLGHDNDDDEIIPRKVIFDDDDDDQQNNNNNLNNLNNNLIICQISCGYHHTIALDTNGNMYSWGGGEKGQHGLSHWEPVLKPSIIAFNQNTENNNIFITSISCGAFHSAAISSVGELYTWGWNQFGQLGLGDSISRCTPQHVRGLNGMDVCLCCCSGDFTSVLSNRFMIIQTDYFSEDEVLSSEQHHNNNNNNNNSNNNNQYNDDMNHTSPIPVLYEEIDENNQQQQQHQQNNNNRHRKSVLQLVKEALSSNKTSTILDPLQDPRGQITPIFNNYRPANLPPKTKAEAKKHANEVLRMNKLYREKLKREAKGNASLRQQVQRKKEHDLKMKRKEEKAHEQREKKLDEAVTFWLETLLPDWENKKHRAKAIELLYKVGVPPRIRGKIWNKSIGNNLMITPQLYDIRRKQSSEVRKQYNEYKEKIDSIHTKNSNSNNNDIVDPVDDIVDPVNDIVDPVNDDIDFKVYGKEASLKLMDIDLPRTFQSLAFFQDGQIMNKQLMEVLDTSCFFRPDLGYVQGMSYLAGNFLLYMTTYEAFVCFSNLLATPLFHTLYSLNDADDECMSPRYHICQLVMQYNTPKVYNMLQNEVPTEFLNSTFRRWLMSLFFNGLELDVAGRICDCYFFYGEEAIYRAVGGIFMCLKSKLLSSENDHCIMTVQNCPQQLNENELLSAMGKVKLSTEIMNEIKKVTLQ